MLPPPNPNSNDSRGNPFPAKAFLFYRARIQFMSKNRRVVCATSDVLAKSSLMPHITGSAKSEQLAGQALIGRRVPPELLHRPPLASRSRGSQREAWQAGLAWQAEVGGILCLCRHPSGLCEAKPPCAAQGPVCLWASGNRSMLRSWFFGLKFSTKMLIGDWMDEEKNSKHTS